MVQLELPYEPLKEGTWVVTPGNLRHTHILITVQEPIVVFTALVFTITQSTPKQEQLFRTLLELNEELLYCAYGLQDEQILISGAQQLESLDFNEFQAMIDDMSMSLDNHMDRLTAWKPATNNSTPPTQERA